MPPIDDLLNDLFANKRPPLFYDLSGWVRASRRYRAFVEANRTKIRAKIARLRNADESADLRAELLTAALILREDSFTLEYEKYASLPGRGPDFTITWKTHTPVNVEVRRLRAAELDLADPDARAVKLVHLLADKIGQTQPGIINLLWIVTDLNDTHAQVEEADIASVMQGLRETAERKQDDFFMRRGYKNSSDFLKRNQQLSAIILHAPDSLRIWQNPTGKHRIPAPLLTALTRTATSQN